MDCGESPKDIIQVLTESLYLENGVLRLNVVSDKVDCEAITPLISCNNSFGAESQLPELIGQDACGNKALRLSLAQGYEELKIRTVTEAGNMLMSDEVIVVDSLVPFDFYLVAASGSGRHKYIKNIGTAVITVNAGFGLIDDVSEVDLNQWECLHILDYDDNTWLII